MNAATVPPNDELTTAHQDRRSFSGRDDVRTRKRYPPLAASDDVAADYARVFFDRSHETMEAHLNPQWLPDERRWSAKARKCRSTSISCSRSRRKWGAGAAAIVTPEIASMVTIDNGTAAPGQNSSEFGVTIAMADQSGPFDYHVTRKLVELCREHAIPFQKDVFRYYRSDPASAIEAGHDVRTALLAFGIDASHGYERIHTHALTSVARLTAVYAASPLEIARDLEEVSGLNGFPRQPTGEADQPQFDPDNVLASADKSLTLLPGKDIRKNKDLTLRVERRAR